MGWRSNEEERRGSFSGGHSHFLLCEGETAEEW
jgi:hypothetical protein